MSAAGGRSDRAVPPPWGDVLDGDDRNRRPAYREVVIRTMEGSHV